jgi:cobalamin biosynthesis protein CobT
MRSTPQIEEILAHTMILVAKLENSDEFEDLKLTNRELRITGIKRTHHYDDTILNNVSEQVKYLKQGLADLFDKPKYIGVGLLKQVKTTLQNEGISISNYNDDEEDENDENEDEDEEEPGNSDSESIDNEESEESEGESEESEEDAEESSDGEHSEEEEYLELVK